MAHKHKIQDSVKRTGVQDFIMILKIDDVPFDVRIGVNVKNHFRFDLSWATALKQLAIKLNRDRVPKRRITPLSFDHWLKNRYTTFSGVYKKKERFYSNWLAIEDLPEKYFAHRYSNEAQAEAILTEASDYPVIRHEKYLITFLERVPIFSQANSLEIRALERIEVKSKSAFEKDGLETFPVYDDRRRFLVRLLNQSLEKILMKRGLSVHEMSQRLKCFFYLLDELNGNKVNFEYEGKSTWKQLVGDYHESKWHYGISFHTLLYPQVCFSLRAHIVFSDDGKTIWQSKSKLHKARRSKGRLFFNEDWRMLMLAFINSLADANGCIQIPVSDEKWLQIQPRPVLFESRFGYDDPKESGRLVPLDYTEERFEESIEEDEEDDDSAVQD